MKPKRTILSMFTVILITAILSLSTGFTVIIHACNACDEFSLKTELFEDHQHNYNDCCCNHQGTENNNNDSSIGVDCCNTSVEQLKITNYLPVDKAKVLQSIIVISEIKPIELKPVITESYFITFDNSEKHGGRQIVTAFHQFLI